MNKKGIEFSINFIVILIIAIITFIFGIYIFTMIFSGGEEFTGQVNEEVQQRINELLITGREPVIIPDIVMDIKRNKVATFAVGIKNDPKLCSSDDFELLVQYDTAVNDKGEEMNLDPQMMATWHFPKSDYKIEKNEREVAAVPIRAGSGATDGWTYVFNIGVRCSGSTDLYGGLYKVYVNVK
ncbi:hypothetical protein KY335_01550 [Candidatus Woesearchaeota archaeon]|nr:hypothetical protein [Candidatus Woesearchaeota archaeon]